MNFIPILTNTVWFLSLIFMIYVVYNCIISVFSFKRIKKTIEYQPKHRFAAIIAARNEEQVIGNLVKSLKSQNYPGDLIDIIVVPNNCTDHTKEVALDNGAIIIEPPFAINSKGKALTYFFDQIFEKNDVYDAFCVFDADNLVHPDFFAKINNALCSGTKIAQGYRDSKNPSDTCTSSCYSIYYLTINRFINHARSALGLSCMINGSGFMISADILRENGGWHTVTMAEDIELTVQCALKGHKIGWVPEAIIYDEQPLTLEQSWKQRLRWSSGILQTLGVYFKDLAKYAVKAKNFFSFDLIVFLCAPIMQVLCFITFIITSILGLMYVNYALFPHKDLYYAMFFSFNYSYFLTSGMALLCVLLEKKNVMKMIKGILTFWIFILVWIPVNVLCLFYKPKVWEQIKHTRNVTISEISNTL